MSESVNVLFRNKQWMVQEEPRGRFLVEVLEHDPEDTENGYWFKADDLAMDNHFPILHTSEKSWVDIDAFEQAVLYAMVIFGIKPNYSVPKKFAEARELKRFSEAEDAELEVYLTS